MKKIVVVEDDNAVREVLVRCLEPLDCSIQTFKDGQEAFKFLDKKASEVDLLIVDQSLPGLSGSALVEEFQKLNPAAPALLISGAELAEVEEDVPVIKKPFSLPDFLRRVKILLEVAQ
ncbi:MAG TPA: response regulator [Acidobacteriota bacterium]|nr:response regulator [Acidobacteriota bacterium]